ncbi:MAG: hypothetical protein PVSMB11_00820 [Desulfuromonadaceae bacterium]
MKITWDSKKAASNPKNHDGVTFDEAQHILFDPLALTREDSDSEDEQRDSSRWEWAVMDGF